MALWQVTQLMTQPIRTRDCRFCCRFRWLQRRVNPRQAASLGITLLLVSIPGCTALPISSNQLSSQIERFLANPWQNPFRQQPNSQPRPSSPAPPLRLGMLFSLSGPLARYGSTMQDSVTLLVETVNNCGGVGGQAVQLFSADDQSNAKAGEAGIAQLAVSQVGVVIGAIGSEVSNATVNIAVKNQIVQISPASANAILTQRALKGEFQGFWFRTMPPDTLQGEALARLAQQKNFKTVAIVAVDNDYGNSIVQAFSATAKPLGITVSKQPIRYSPYARVYDVDFRTAFAEQPDAVLVVAQPDLGGDILKAAFESGIWNGTTKVLLPASMKNNGLATRAGRSTDGRYNASNVWGITLSSSPTMPQFRELYKQRFGHEPGPYDAHSWDAAAVAVLAAEAAHDSSGKAIRSKISEVASDPGIEVSDLCQALSLVREGKDINYQGTSGTIDFNQAGDAVGNYDVWTIDYMGMIKIPPQSPIQVGSSVQPPKASVTP